MTQPSPAKAPKTTLVACLGDSLTQGQASANYVQLLENRLADDGYRFLNAGINGDLTFNLLQRLDEVIAQQPDIVTLLIGSNDINATFDKKTAARYQKYKDITGTPSIPWSMGNLNTIVARLKSAGIHRIALLSIPMIGEDLDSSLNDRVCQYNQQLRELASRLQLHYLPLHEQLTSGLPRDHQPPPYRGRIWPMIAAGLKVKLLHRSWNQTSAANGLWFLTDFIHLNERGAEVIANLVAGYIHLCSDASSPLVADNQ